MEANKELIQVPNKEDLTQHRSDLKGHQLVTNQDSDLKDQAVHQMDIPALKDQVAHQMDILALKDQADLQMDTQALKDRKARLVDFPALPSHRAKVLTPRLKVHLRIIQLEPPAQLEDTQDLVRPLPILDRRAHLLHTPASRARNLRTRDLRAHLLRTLLRRPHRVIHQEHQVAQLSRLDLDLADQAVSSHLKVTQDTLVARNSLTENIYHRETKHPLFYNLIN